MGFGTFRSTERVTQAISVGGEQTGVNDEEDAYDRDGLYFSEAIGYIIRVDDNKTPLY